MAKGDVVGLVEGLDLYEPAPPGPDPTEIVTGPVVEYAEPMHLRFPLEIRAGDFVMVGQDTQADVDGCVEAVARCPRGWLDSLPTMGLPDYALTRGRPSVDDIRAGIAPFEPRADLSVDSELEQLAAAISIDPGRVTGGV